jgi:hypothetical protein
MESIRASHLIDPGFQHFQLVWFFQTWYISKTILWKSLEKLWKF